jgi:hypothetical protein
MIHPKDLWRRLSSFGKMSPLQRAASDLEETLRKRYESSRVQEELAAYLSMLDKREKALRAMIGELSKEPPP